jgi:hypothetical protein
MSSENNASAPTELSPPQDAGLNKAGTLTSSEIEKYKIIQWSGRGKKISHTQWQPTSFDLRLGESHYLSEVDAPKKEERKWRSVYIGEGEKLPSLNKKRYSEKLERPRGDQADALVIPPFAAALIKLGNR